MVTVHHALQLLNKHGISLTYQQLLQKTKDGTFISYHYSKKEGFSYQRKELEDYIKKEKGEAFVEKQEEEKTKEEKTKEPKTDEMFECEQLKKEIVLLKKQLKKANETILQLQETPSSFYQVENKKLQRLLREKEKECEQLKEDKTIRIRVE